MLSSYLVDFLAYSKRTTHFSIIIVFIKTSYKGWNLGIISFLKNQFWFKFTTIMSLSLAFWAEEKGQGHSYSQEMLRVLRMPTECQACEWHVTSGIQTQIITHVSCLWYARHSSRCFILINSSPPHQHSIKYHYCHHFINEENWAERLNDLPKAT